MEIENQVVDEKNSTSKSMCLNGGFTLSNQFQCICPPGFIGQFCEKGKYINFLISNLRIILLVLLVINDLNQSVDWCQQIKHVIICHRSVLHDLKVISNPATNRKHRLCCSSPLHIAYL